MPQVGRVLVIEDDDALRAAIARIARGWGADVTTAGTAREGLAALAEEPDLVIADVRLPDGSALPIVEAAARRKPAPAVVALSGLASPEEAFRLAQAGVRGYLAKPITGEALTAKVDEALASVPSLEPLAVACVGRAPMRDVQERVRQAMVGQALARANGSRSGAARLLRVSRQAVQQIVRARERNG